MYKTLNITSLLALIAIMLLAGIAATPNTPLPKPTNVSAAATANAGEISVSWNASSGAQFYAIAWVNLEEAVQILNAGQSLDDAIQFSTIPATRTTHTIKDLRPGTSYLVLVGSRMARYEGNISWASAPPVTTAGQHGDGFCPITGLPLPAGGYLNVGDTQTWVDGSFTLYSATTPASVPIQGGRTYTPPEGRKLLDLCSTWTNRTGGNLYFQAGTHNNLSTDRGIGFIPVLGWGDAPIRNGQTESACDVWSIPATATTAVYAISNGSNPDVLYQIDLTQ